MTGPSVEQWSHDNAIVPEGPAFVYPAWKQAPLQEVEESTDEKQHAEFLQKEEDLNLLLRRADLQALSADFQRK